MASWRISRFSLTAISTAGIKPLNFASAKMANMHTSRTIKASASSMSVILRARRSYRKSRTIPASRASISTSWAICWWSTRKACATETNKNWTSGIRLFDITDPAKPREAGFFKTDTSPNRGVHGFWLHEDPKQGKFAFIATTLQGYFGAILLIVDINNPANPKEVSRWWFPGQHTAGGEKVGENWIDDGGLRDGLPKIWVSLHDLTTYKDRAYLAYRDQGVIILDISDLKKPTKISQIKWSPPEEGNTHSIGVVIPAHGGRPDVILATDEITSAKQCPFGYLHVLDVRHEPNPVQIGTFRLPLNRFCPPDRPGRRFGIHDIERMVKGNIVFSAWENAGFWAIDISDPYHPKAAGHFVPPVFRRANADSGHADDVFVHESGLVFASSSDPGGGFWIMRHTPGVKGTVEWTADNKNITVKYDKPRQN